MTQSGQQLYRCFTLNCTNFTKACMQYIPQHLQFRDRDRFGGTADEAH
ncbi:MAG: hypothetical protein F6K28_37730 [Microcoleus sp. SIO2G3]|nr:hypothetical protein [Microcoleus sp. SIO2G3]